MKRLLLLAIMLRPISLPNKNSFGIVAVVHVHWRGCFLRNLPTTLNLATELSSCLLPITLAVRPSC